MFSAFMNIFFARVLEVDYGAVSDLADEGVVMDGTLVEKCFGQTVYKLVQEFDMKNTGVDHINKTRERKKSWNAKRRIFLL